MRRKSSRFRKRRTNFPLRRSTKHHSVVVRRASKFLRHISKIEGVEEIILSPLTQKFVECDIGNKVTLVSPWIYVDKEKVETHLEYYQNESCFHIIKEEIEEFPKDEILVGSYSCAIDKPAKFFICTTLSAEETILQLVEQQRNLIREKVRKMQLREPGSDWISQGSENAVEAEMNINNRNLYLVDVHAIILIKQKTKFKFRLVHEILNGYIAMLPSERNTFNSVMRKRLDKGVQCAPIFLHKSVQSYEAGLITKSVQYCYECPEIRFTTKLALNVRNFLQVIYRDVCNQLDDNIHMRLEVNDYQSLANQSDIKILHRPVEIRTYQDIDYCTGKKISCLSWNALTSGIVAAAYATNPLFYMLKEGPIEDIIKHPAEDTHFVLIWDYKNNVKPRLYLHCKAEITSISFCPYNKNILVGGYINGQIAIWDLTESFINYKPLKYRTIREQYNHVQISLMTSWMKKALGGKHIFPTITSTVEVSHTSPVTSISWMPPAAFIGDDYDKSQEHKMKFVTSDLDGNVILIWILNPNADVTNIRLMVKSRVSTKPEALTRGVSKLKQLQAHFFPLCKLYLNSLVKPKNNPMLKVIVNNEMYNYKTLNPKTLRDLDVETNFEVTGLMYPLNRSEKILFTTGLGVLQVASCAGAKFNNEESLEICSIETLETVHDGPILGCESNIFFPNLILTVGGSVFAIWDYSQLEVALMWRKSKLRYVAGMWCLHRPLSIILVRNDRFFEYWNICENSKTPLQIFKYKGYEPIYFYANTNRFHMRKNTFIATDNVGSFKVLLLPSETFEQKEYNISEAEDCIKHIVKLKKYHKIFKLQFTKIHDEIVEILVENSVKNVKSIETIPEPVKVKPSRAAKFQEKLEQHGISILLGLKGLNADKLEAIKLPLTDDFKAEEIIRKQLKQTRAKRAEMVKLTKEQILIQFRKSYPRRHEIKTTITKDQARKLKTQFIEEYTKIENDIKQRFSSNDFKSATEKSFIDIYKKKQYIEKPKHKKKRKTLIQFTSKSAKNILELSAEITSMEVITNVSVVNMEKVITEV